MANTGRIVWTELATPDPGAAAAFYAAALGWTCKTIPSPMGQGEYHLYSNGDGEVAGMLAMEGPQWEGIPSHWLSYVSVPDVDAAVAKAVDAGGQVLAPAFDIPTIGRIAVLADPLGAALGLITPVPSTAD
ncbi:MAG: VOC family protein [Rhodospirillaceae bacterium]|nr:VOC family protein [Rhodospirillaceae bacterium]MCA8931166.1 VOC family protein [Rhodospirillaceae bacterium]